MKLSKKSESTILFIIVFALGVLTVKIFNPRDFKENQYKKYLNEASYDDAFIRNLAFDVIKRATIKYPFVIALDSIKERPVNYDEQRYMETAFSFSGIYVYLSAYENEQMPMIRIKSPVDEIECRFLSKLSGKDIYYVSLLNNKSPWTRDEVRDGKLYKVIYKNFSNLEEKEAKKRFCAYLLLIYDKLK